MHITRLTESVASLSPATPTSTRKKLEFALIAQVGFESPEEQLFQMLRRHR